MMQTPNNGPKHGRNRNTMHENARQAGRRADPFPLDPTAQVQFGMQARNLRFQNRVTMASLGQQAADVREQYKNLRSGLVQEGQAGLSAVSGDVADRGLAGSSVQLAGEQEVFGATQQGITDAESEKFRLLRQINMERLNAIAAKRMGLSDIALQRGAEQRRLALLAFGSGGQNPWGY